MRSRRPQASDRAMLTGLVDFGVSYLSASGDEDVTDQAGREEALGGDSRIGLEPRRQRRRIVESRAAVVGDQAAVGARRGARAERHVVAEPGERRGEAEG